MCRTHCDSFGILSFTSKPGHSFITSVAHSISSMFTQPNEHIYHQPNNPSAPSIQPIPAPCTACACSNCKPRATRKTSYTHSPQQTSSNRTPRTNARNKLSRSYVHAFAMSKARNKTHTASLFQSTTPFAKKTVL